jgi:ABC-2 type transport system permease protein
MRSLQPWFATASLAATSSVAESPLFVLEFVMRGLRVSVLLALWRVVLQTETHSPISLGSVLTYTWLSEIFALQLSARTSVAEAFWQGTLTQHFLRPMGLVGQFVSETLGQWLVGFVCFSLPLALGARWLGVDPRPASVSAALGFMLSLPLAISVGFAIDFIFAALTVALEQPIWQMNWVRQALTVVLSGSLVPLALYPFGLGNTLEYSPFAALSWAPLAIYTGTGAVSKLLGLQVFWSLALWPLAGWLWSANREKVVGYGG